MSDHEQSWKKIISGRPFQFLLAAARIALGAVFLYAGITKIADPAGFSQAVYNYHLLPSWLVNMTAIILPWVEVVAGTCLVLGLWIPGGALIISTLLFIFIIALGLNLTRGLDIACGCFSTSPAAGKITWWYLLRDSSLLAAALLVLLADRDHLSWERVMHNYRKRTR